MFLHANIQVQTSSSRWWHRLHWLKETVMLKQDLSDLYAQFVDSDDVPVDEVMSAIRTYSEENDLLFTEVLSDLHEEQMAAIRKVQVWTTCYRQSLLQS